MILLKYSFDEELVAQRNLFACKALDEHGLHILKESNEELTSWLSNRVLVSGSVCLAMTTAR